MILYFTGTGNSKYVADMLADILDDNVVDITKINSKVLESEKPWVFVSPVYVSAPPKVFMSTIKDLKFSGNDKAYFINTCAGGMGACPYYSRKITKEVGLNYMGCEQIIMPQNYICYFTTKSEEESLEIINEAKPYIIELSKKIRDNVCFDKMKNKHWETASTKMILGMYYRRFIKTTKFNTNGSCKGCGLCSKVCPLKNIEIKDNKPVWGNNCTHCMACINYCPSKSINYGKKTESKYRYKCPKYNKDAQ